MSLLKIMGAAAVLGLSVAVAEAQPVVLKFSYATMDQEVRWVRVIKPFIDAVNADPSGAVKIDGFPNGALGRSLPQQPQMVLDGVADIAFVVPSLSSGRFPDDALFELPALTTNLAEGTQLYEALVRSNALRGYSDYVVLGAFLNANLSFYSRRPIKALADLKGLKVRIPGPVIAQTVKELGMVPVLMPPNEVVEALGRGTVDALVTEPVALVDFGMDRVTSHDYPLEIGTNQFAVLMNRAKFEALSQPAKDLLNKYSGAAFGDRYIKAMTITMQDAHKRMRADPKRTVVGPSPTEFAQAERIFAGVKKEWAAKNQRNAELLAKAENILADTRSQMPQ